MWDTGCYRKIECPILTCYIVLKRVLCNAVSTNMLSCSSTISTDYCWTFENSNYIVPTVTKFIVLVQLQFSKLLGELRWSGSIWEEEMDRWFWLGHFRSETTVHFHLQMPDWLISSSIFVICSRWQYLQSFAFTKFNLLANTTRKYPNKFSLGKTAINSQAFNSYPNPSAVL